MLHKESLFDIALPRLPARHILEKLHEMPPRISVLDNEFDEAALEVSAAWDARRAEREIRASIRDSLYY